MSNDGVLIIPAETNGYPVTSVDGYPFPPYQSAYLTSVTIPGSITNIGYQAFSGCVDMTNLQFGAGVLRIRNGAFSSCHKLPSVVLPDSMTNIDNAFSYCGQLTNITIGKGLMGIGGWAFFQCPKLARFSVDPLNPFLSSADDVLFNKDQTALLACGTAHGPGYLIPQTVTNIGNFAFAQCTNLTAITIPDTVTSLGTNVFYQCTGLTNVLIGNGVTSIPVYTFQSCSNLLSITFSASVTNTTSYAFGSCKRLSSIYFLGDVPSGSYPTLFASSTNGVVYYLPGAVGWGPTFGGLPTMQLGLPMQSVKLNTSSPAKQFDFDINWANGKTVVIEATTNLANPDWLPIATNNVGVDPAYFSDPDLDNHTTRFYRIHSQ